MKEIYSWVPWFRELAKKIEDGGEAYLIEKAKEVDWGNSRSLLEYGDENIDPFSFFYFLAQKNTAKQRELVYASVHEVFSISYTLPEPGREGVCNHPTPPSFAPVLFHNGKEFNHDLLWELFRQAVKSTKDKLAIQPENFNGALGISGVGVPKLTQCLSLINPESFIPIHDWPAQNETKKRIETEKWGAYRQALDDTKRKFPECHFYEVGQVYYQLSKKISLRQNFYQISTNVYDDGNDYWSDFEKNNWVYTGGPGSRLPWEQANEGKYPLKMPEPGDIILVRKGRKKGKAIGFVEKNDHAERGLDKTSKIHVLWLNKSESRLSYNTVLDGFSRLELNSNTYQAFRNTDSYKPTFEFIGSRTKNFIEEEPAPYPVGQEQKPTNHRPLNQILYGPPGTGKTWNTVNHAVAIIDDESVDDLKNKDRKEITKRFNELKEAGLIGMVTFHQNYSYEDFIEGIRPVLSEKQKTEDGEQGDKRYIKYELSEGIFKRIALRAKNDLEQKSYVLIIDEINRGNIAKIFGELITLIEESKRLGEKKDEATATLPYSKESFGVPNNLYIIGTMNTADRSIALLDTALRRRFDFVEMMPYPRHSGISTDIQGVNCRKLLEKINERIRILRDRDHQIGHTYFLDVKDLDSLAKTFKNRIIPLLQEYFYDNWEKIDLVLNRNGFIKGSGVDESLLRDSDLVDAERKVYELLPADDNKWEDPESYKTIYETQKQPLQDGQDNQSE